MPRLHPLSAALDAVRSGGQLALFALFGGTALAGMGGGGGGGIADLGPLVLLAVPAAFLVGAGLAVARWYRFEYEVLPEHLVVRSGVFSRQDREIPMRRIQNVDVRRSLLQRALGLATVQVETAGGSSTEATLDALSSDDADRLREELGRRGRRAREAGRGERAAVEDAARGDDAAASADDGDGAEGSVGADRETATGAGAYADADEPERETLYELTGRRFAVLCAVSFRPGAVFAPFVGASLFDDLIFDGGRLLVRLGVIDVDLADGLPTLGRSDLLPLVVVSVAAFLLVVWVVSALLTFVRYYGFTLERVGDELRYERGLLGRYSGNVPLSKVQTVTVSENVAMRRLGYAGLAVDTAGYAPGSNDDDGGSETAVPLDTRERVVALAADVRRELGDGEQNDPSTDGADAAGAADDAVGVDPVGAGTDAGDPDPFDPATVERPPGRARRRYVARYAIAVLVATGVALAFDRFLLDLPRYLPLVPLAGLLLAPVAGHLTWANRGHATVDDGFVTRTGTLRRHTRLVPYFRLQTVFVTRSPFQRRRELASVIGDSASSSGVLGGDATAYDIDARGADALREELLDRLREDLAARRRARLARRPDVRRDPTPGGASGEDVGATAAAPAGEIGVDDGASSTPAGEATGGNGGDGDGDGPASDGDDDGGDVEGNGAGGDADRPFEWADPAEAAGRRDRRSVENGGDGAGGNDAAGNDAAGDDPAGDGPAGNGGGGAGEDAAADGSDVNDDETGSDNDDGDDGSSDDGDAERDDAER